MTSIHPEPTFAPISFVNATSLPASLSLSGRTAVVTGSSSGLGRSISLRLARLGCIVVCADLAPSSSATAKLPGALSKPTHELINENGGTGYFQKLDVTDYSAVEGVVRFAVDQASPNKRLDIMVNNAGIPGFLAGKGSALIHTEDPAQAEKIIKVNLMGIWNGTKAAVTQMLEQDILSFPVDLDLSVELGDNPTLEVEAQQQGEPPQRGSRGVIVNMGSIHGMVCGPAERNYNSATRRCFGLMILATYSSSKGAVINLSRTVAIDYAPQRINVNCVCPGCTLSSSRYLSVVLRLIQVHAISQILPFRWWASRSNRSFKRVVFALGLIWERRGMSQTRSFILFEMLRGRQAW